MNQCLSNLMKYIWRIPIYAGKKDKIEKIKLRKKLKFRI